MNTVFMLSSLCCVFVDCSPPIQYEWVPTRPIIDFTEPNKEMTEYESAYTSEIRSNGRTGAVDQQEENEWYLNLYHREN